MTNEEEKRVCRAVLVAITISMFGGVMIGLLYAHLTGWRPF